MKDFQKKREEESKLLEMKTAAEKDVRPHGWTIVFLMLWHVLQQLNVFVHCMASLKELREQLESAHQQELLSVQQANHLAVSVLREEMERQKTRELEQNLQEHQLQMGTFHSITSQLHVLGPPNKQ